MSFRFIHIFLAMFLVGGGLTLHAGTSPAPGHAGRQAAGKTTSTMRHRRPARKRLDINSASKAALAKVPGLNASLAAQIIAHRPYLTKEHLVLNHVIPEPLFLSIREYVTAIPPGAHKAPAKPARPSRKPTH